MNAIEKEMINYTYENKKINNWVRIFKRTKKERIKNKLFAEILVAGIKERKCVICEGVVMLDVEVYTFLLNDIERLKKEKEELEQKVGKVS